MELPQAPRVRANVREVVRRTLIGFVPLLVLVVGIAWIVYTARVRAAEELLRRQEQVAVELQRQTLAEDMAGVVSDVLFHGRTLHLARDIWGADPAAAAARQELALLMLRFAEARGIYDQIRVLDGDGQERIRINFNGGAPTVVPEQDLQNKGGRYYFTDTWSLEAGDVFVSPLDLNIERGQIEQPLKPMIRVGTPVVDARGTKRGIVLVNYLGARLLERFQELGRTSPGVPMLVNRDGYYLHGPTPADSWGFMIPGREQRLFTRDHPAAWERIHSTETGQFETPAGLFTHRRVRPLPAGLHSSTGAAAAVGESLEDLAADEYAWTIVSLLPPAVYHAEAVATRQLLIPAVLFSLCLIAFATYRQAYAKAYRRAAQSSRETLITKLQQALTEVKTLRGILPICMHCKKIRNDEEAWDRVEHYIAERTEVAFSHGICPECLEEHYGELFEGEKAQTAAAGAEESQRGKQ